MYQIISSKLLIANLFRASFFRTKSFGSSATLCLAIVLTLVVSPVYGQDTPSVDEWEAWVKKYDTGRRSADGWLALVGLYWLKEGNNSLGSDPGNLHRFPDEMPAKFGEISVIGNQIMFSRASPAIRIDGKDIDQLQLIPNETIVSLNSHSFYIIERERGYAIRLKNVDNPAIKAFSGTQFYPYADSWLIPARLVRHESPQKIRIATVYATLRESDSAGWLEFDYQGTKQRLQAVSYGPDEPMMLMFADGTSRKSTYGAGRFLDVQWPQEGNDQTYINFNKAYNPPCAITAFATCPLPPPQNRLKISIEAGELFTGH